MLSDEELLALADVVDWWIQSGAETKVMRSLRSAVVQAAAAGSARLYRPPGPTAAPIWIDAAQIARLNVLFEGRARRCA